MINYGYYCATHGAVVAEGCVTGALAGEVERGTEDGIGVEVLKIAPVTCEAT